LANNKLKELVDLAPAALIRALPNLQNLSLKNNLLADIKSLNPLMTDESISRTGLNCLAELVLEGNPMREVALANGTYPAFVQ
jgi:Leucine-rich repeat (LRR) protein